MKIDRIRPQLKRDQSQFRDASIFLVATEGEKTEKIYLSIFHSSRIKVVTINCDDGHSSPEGVFEKIRSALDRFDFESNDTFWMLIDRDQWKEAALARVNSEAKKLGVKLLVSNERFEVFLSHHFKECHEDDDFKNGEYEKFLRKHLGTYQKNKFDSSSLAPLVSTACSSCREMDDQTTELWPPVQCSRAYMLIEAIIKKL